MLNLHLSQFNSWRLFFSLPVLPFTIQATEYCKTAHEMVAFVYSRNAVCTNHFDLMGHMPWSSSSHIWGILMIFHHQPKSRRVSPGSPCPTLPNRWWMIGWCKASDPLQPDSSAAVNGEAFRHLSCRHFLTWMASFFLRLLYFFRMVALS